MGKRKRNNAGVRARQGLAWGWLIAVQSDKDVSEESREEFAVRLDRALQAAGIIYRAEPWRVSSEVKGPK